MGTQYPELFAKLTERFHPEDEKTRTHGGRELKYITARTVQNRLDDVLGPECWWARFSPTGDNGVLCTLSIMLPDGRVIEKQDAGGFAGMSDAGDDEKSGHSDALKRAAVMFGIGRYLYRDGSPYYGAGDPQTPGPQSPDRQQHRDPEQNQRQSQPPPSPSRQTNYDKFRLPTVRADKNVVYAWVMGMQEHFKIDLLGSANEIAKAKGYPKNFRDWTQDQSNDVCGYIAKYLSCCDNYAGEFNGKVDLEKIGTESSAASVENLKAVRIAIIEAIKEANRIAMGREATTTEIRSCLDAISAQSPKRDGSRGEVVQVLNQCGDLKWMENMLSLAKEDVAEAKARASSAMSAGDVDF